MEWKQTKGWPVEARLFHTGRIKAETFKKVHYFRCLMTCRKLKGDSMGGKVYCAKHWGAGRTQPKRRSVVL